MYVVIYKRPRREKQNAFHCQNTGIFSLLSSKFRVVLHTGNINFKPPLTYLDIIFLQISGGQVIFQVLLNLNNYNGRMQMRMRFKISSNMCGWGFGFGIDYRTARVCVWCNLQGGNIIIFTYCRSMVLRLILSSL